MATDSAVATPRTADGQAPQATAPDEEPAWKRSVREDLQAFLQRRR